MTVTPRTNSTASERNPWYLEYLESTHWKEVRARKVAEAGFACERCGQFGRRTKQHTIAGLNVHHLNYERVGSELDSDLEVLCGFCHQVEHGYAEDTRANRDRWRARLTERIIGYWDPYEDEIELEIASWDALPDGQVV